MNLPAEAFRGDVLDSHVHLWDTQYFPLDWLASAPWLPQKVTLEDLQLEAAESRVPTAVAVQAGSSSAEAAWLRDHTAQSVNMGQASSLDSQPKVPRIVVQYEPRNGQWAGTVHAVVADDAVHQRVAGIRLPLHRLAEDWRGLLGLDDLVLGVANRGMLVELLIRPDQLLTAVRFAKDYPHVPFVVCHLGLGAAEPDRQWQLAMHEAGTAENLSAKVSGLFKSGVDALEDAARVQSAVDTALDTLGAQRLLFGSDWPMSKRIGTYEDILARSVQAFNCLGQADLDSIFSANAQELYRLQ